MWRGGGGGPEAAGRGEGGAVSAGREVPDQFSGNRPALLTVHSGFSWPNAVVRTFSSYPKPAKLFFG